MNVSTPTLAEQVSVMVENLAAQAPPEALSAFKAEQADLDLAGVPDGVAAPGTPMPDASTDWYAPRNDCSPRTE